MPIPWGQAFLWRQWLEPPKKQACFISPETEARQAQDCELLWLKWGHIFLGALSTSLRPGQRLLETLSQDGHWTIPRGIRQNHYDSGRLTIPPQEWWVKWTQHKSGYRSLKNILNTFEITHTHTHTQIYIHILSLCVYIYIYLYVCMFVYVCVCVCVCIFYK